MFRRFPNALSVLTLFSVAANPLNAQQRPTGVDSTTRDSVFRLAAISVTASRTAVALFYTPAHVSILDAGLISRTRPNNIADLFLDVPGLDAEGVGAAQRKPVIRGMIGQRLLLLEDGLRLNNTRREQDRGETPALIGLERIERIEVVRGASSVLYGSDAVGGVINVITRPTDRSGPDQIHGRITGQYSSAGEQRRSELSLWGALGRLSFSVDGSYRNADPYSAPAGQFGDLSLASKATVNDTGVEDFSINGSAQYAISERHSVSLKQSFYNAKEAGFGFVDPNDLGAPGLTVQLLFPNQDFARTTLSYKARDLRSPLTDRLEIAAYSQSNERDFNTIVSGPLGPPGAALNSITENFTDLDTKGYRLDAQKFVGTGVLLTYGSDFFQDRSTNTDVSTRTVTGFGPPSTTTSGTRVPDAVFSSAGFFAQGRITPVSRLDITLGARFQSVKISSHTTAGITGPLVSKSDRTVVGAANLLFRVNDRINLVSSVGRAFRSPNLVESFFQGVSPDGRAYWSVNPDLEPETSLNSEVGLKYFGNDIEFEGYLFRNNVFNGITDLETGAIVNGLPVRQNQNLDEIRFNGFELAGKFYLPAGLYAAVDWSHLTGVADTSVGSSTIPGETYSTRLGARLGYINTGGGLSADYGIRYTSKKDDVDWRSSPVGVSAPAYTVHSARVQVAVLPQKTVTISVNNVFDELYAETANMAFFRPEPGRNVTIAIGAEF